MHLDKRIPQYDWQQAVVLYYLSFIIIQTILFVQTESLRARLLWIIEKALQVWALQSFRSNGFFLMKLRLQDNTETLTNKIWDLIFYHEFVMAF